MAINEGCKPPSPWVGLRYWSSHWRVFHLWARKHYGLSWFLPLCHPFLLSWSDTQQLIVSMFLTCLAIFRSFLSLTTVMWMCCLDLNLDWDSAWPLFASSKDWAYLTEETQGFWAIGPVWLHSTQQPTSINQCPCGQVPLWALSNAGSHFGLVPSRSCFPHCTNWPEIDKPPPRFWNLTI